jgi:hypothetical protein
VVYQIYTEDLPRHRSAVVSALKKHGFKYFTISPPNIGYGPNQDGEQEYSMMIWIAPPNYSWRVDERMERAVKEIRHKNGDQGSVLLMRIPAYPTLVERPKRRRSKRRRTSSDDSCSCEAPTCEVLPSLPGEGKPFPVPRPTRGKIMAAAGNWARLLPKNAELRGKVVRFLPE